MSKDTREDAITKAAAGAMDTLNLPEGKSLQDIMSNPAMMADLSQKLASVINTSSAVDLPPGVLKRVKAMKNLQKATTQIEARFYKEVQCLEAKYHKLYQPYYDKRQAIMSGTYEPTDDECKWSEDEHDPESSLEEKASEDSDQNDIRGVPDFWLTALKNCDILSDTIYECDDEVLSSLIDIKVVYADDKGLDFTIEYHFSENDWFTNRVLTMSYFVTCEVDADDPWSFEGATIYACQGCPIDWKKGKNLTVKTVKKKSKSKGKGQSKTITKQVPNDTFFNMFSFTKADKNPDQDDTLSQTLSDNYNRAEFIRDRLVPRAVLFFTGEAVDEDEDEYDGDYEDDEEDAEGGEDYNPQQDLNAAKPPECKQQ